MYTVLTAVLCVVGLGLTQLNSSVGLTVVEQKKCDAPCLEYSVRKSRKKYFTNDLKDLDIDDGKGF
jgi:hypothetical protein